MLKDELSDLLDGAVTARVKRDATERRQLRAVTGHLEPTEHRVLLELVEKRSQWLEYHEGEDWIEGLDPAGFFPTGYLSLQANMRPRRRDSASRAMTKGAVTKAMKGLEEKELIQRRRGGNGEAYKYRLELDWFEAREPVDGDAARHDVRVMMSEAQLAATPLMVMAQLRYLANDGRLALDRKQVEQQTGFSHKTVKTTLEALLPENLGYCAGLGSFYEDDRVFRIEFKAADSMDPDPLLIKPKPLILVGFPGVDDDRVLTEPVEEHDPRMDVSFDDPDFDKIWAASKTGTGETGETNEQRGETAEKGFPATRASRSADTRSSAQASPAPLPTSPPVPPIVDDDARFAIEGEMPEDRTVEDEFSVADLPEELLG
jgi:DNA-binding transcriptional ArsR family regulator